MSDVPTLELVPPVDLSGQSIAWRMAVPRHRAPAWVAGGVGMAAILAFAILTLAIMLLALASLVIAGLAVRTLQRIARSELRATSS